MRPAHRVHRVLAVVFLGLIAALLVRAAHQATLRLPTVVYPAHQVPQVPQVYPVFPVCLVKKVELLLDLLVFPVRELPRTMAFMSRTARLPDICLINWMLLITFGGGLQLESGLWRRLRVGLAVIYPIPELFLQLGLTMAREILRPQSLGLIDV